MLYILAFTVRLLGKVVDWLPFLMGLYTKLTCITFRKMVKDEFDDNTYYSDEVIITSMALYRLDPDGYERLYEERQKNVIR